MLKNIANLKGAQVLSKNDQLMVNGGGSNPPNCIQQGNQCCFRINGQLWCDYGVCCGPSQCHYS